MFSCPTMINNKYWWIVSMGAPSREHQQKPITFLWMPEFLQVHPLWFQGSNCFQIIGDRTSSTWHCLSTGFWYSFSYVVGRIGQTPWRSCFWFYFIWTSHNTYGVDHRTKGTDTGFDGGDLLDSITNKSWIQISIHIKYIAISCKCYNKNIAKEDCQSNL